MSDRIYYTAKEVQEMLGVSRATAYKIIRSLNDELISNGYIVIAGKIPKQYLKEKYYGMSV